MSEHNEAPASMNYRLVYKGVEIQFTQRDPNKDIQIYMLQAMKDIDLALTRGLTAPVPRSNGYQKKEALPAAYANYSCPQCGSKVVKETTKTGKAIEKCETQKYNWQTKVTEGCSYIKWL